MSTLLWDFGRHCQRSVRVCRDNFSACGRRCDPRAGGGRGCVPPPSLDPDRCHIPPPWAPSVSCSPFSILRRERSCLPGIRKPLSSPLSSPLSLLSSAWLFSLLFSHLFFSYPPLSLAIFPYPLFLSFLYVGAFAYQQGCWGWNKQGWWV